MNVPEFKGIHNFTFNIFSPFTYNFALYFSIYLLLC